MDALRAHRARAKTDALFLHEEARASIQDRLGLVNRSFTNPAVVTTFPQMWGTVVPHAVCVPDADIIGLERGAHDLVVHAMGLHWANDPVGQLIQCRHALKADGLFLCIVFGGETLIELRDALRCGEVAATGGLSPRVSPMPEIRDMGSLMQRAGFALPVADSEKITVQYPSLTALLHDLRNMGETNALTDRPKHLTRRTVFDETAAQYQAKYSADGRLTATFELITLTGWSPAENQPKPLRPGSARTRLADALGTSETKLPD